MKIGYARVSTGDQTTAAQLEALQAAGCDRIIEEKASTRAKLPLRDRMFAELDQGDSLIVWRFDRLARSTKELLGIVEDAKARGIELCSLSEKIDTATAAGKALFGVAAVIAEFERDVIRERTMSGLAAARAKGRIGGRPHALTTRQADHARQLIEAGDSVTAVARSFKVAPSTLRLALKRIVGAA